MLVCTAIDIVHTLLMGSRMAESMRAALDSSVQALLSLKRQAVLILSQLTQRCPNELQACRLRHAKHCFCGYQWRCVAAKGLGVQVQHVRRALQGVRVHALGAGARPVRVRRGRGVHGVRHPPGAR